MSKKGTIITAVAAGAILVSSILYSDSQTSKLKEELTIQQAASNDSVAVVYQGKIDSLAGELKTSNNKRSELENSLSKSNGKITSLNQKITKAQSGVNQNKESLEQYVADFGKFVVQTNQAYSGLEKEVSDNVSISKKADVEISNRLNELRYDFDSHTKGDSLNLVVYETVGKIMDIYADEHNGECCERSGIGKILGHNGNYLPDFAKDDGLTKGGDKRLGKLFATNTQTQEKVGSIVYDIIKTGKDLTNYGAELEEIASELYETHLQSHNRFAKQTHYEAAKEKGLRPFN